jgi:hypothetical protein
VLEEGPEHSAKLYIYMYTAMGPGVLSGRLLPGIITAGIPIILKFVRKCIAPRRELLHASRAI